MKNYKSLRVLWLDSYAVGWNIKLSLMLGIFSLYAIQARATALTMNTTVPTLIDLVSTENEQQTVTGKITDSNGLPVPGASIVEKGTSNGAASDIDGNYSITVSSANATLLVSYIGFATKEVAVGQNTNLNIQLEEDSSALEEVVLVAYGTATKKDLTGSVAVISAEELNTFP